MSEIAESTSLVATTDWSILQMLPIRFSVDASEEAVAVTLPLTTDVVGGQTQLLLDVIDVTEATTIDTTGDDTINGAAAPLTIEVAGSYVVTIGAEGNWLVTTQYVPEA
jgi:hypothetical protein